MSSLADEFTCRDCYSCPLYKPSKYEFALNQTMTNDLEFVLQLMLFLILGTTYYVAGRQIKLSDYYPQLIYYFIVLLFYICGTSYSILRWLLHYDQNIYFNQKIHFYLVDQSAILLTSFFLLIASKKLQELGHNINLGLTVWILQLQNIFCTLANSIWLIVVVFYYNLCSGQIEFYQSSQLQTTFICLITIGFIYQLLIRQQESFKTQIPLMLLYVIFFIGILLKSIQYYLKYYKQLWFIEFKYGLEWNEIREKFDDVVYFNFQNNARYSIQDFVIQLFTVCLPFLIFIQMYSKDKQVRNVDHILNIN